MTESVVINKQPKALYFLFFSEMWERFSYFGIRAIAVLFMTKVFLFEDKVAALSYGTYIAFAFISPLLGGIIADRYIGQVKGIIIGACFIILGNFFLAIEVLHPGEMFIETMLGLLSFLHVSQDFEKLSFFLGLSLVAVGTGFFKPNISALLGQNYDKNDPREDAGFTLFYMGINIGSILASLSVAYVAVQFGWHYGFMLSAIGMSLGLIIFLSGLKTYPKKHIPVNNNIKHLGIHIAIILGTFFLALFASYFISHPEAASNLVTTTGGIVVVFFFIQIVLAQKEDRKHLIAIFILTFVSIFFWAFFELKSSTFILYLDRLVDRNLFGHEIAAGAFNALNGMFIILLTPVFYFTWEKLASKGKEPSIPVKFAISFLFMGVAFMVIAFSAKYAATSAVSMLWVVVTIMFITSGELCLSPIGLSMVSKLSPPKLIGFLMGTWFLALGFANYLSGMLAGLANIPTYDLTTLDTKAMAGIYYTMFTKISFIAFALFIFMLIISPFVQKLMQPKPHQL